MGSCPSSHKLGTMNEKFLVSFSLTRSSYSCVRDTSFCRQSLESIDLKYKKGLCRPAYWSPSRAKVEQSILGPHHTRPRFDFHQVLGRPHTGAAGGLHAGESSSWFMSCM